MKTTKVCSDCEGYGRNGSATCDTCRGAGKVFLDGSPTVELRACHHCGGVGCDACVNGKIVVALGGES